MSQADQHRLDPVLGSTGKHREKIDAKGPGQLPGPAQQVQLLQQGQDAAGPGQEGAARRMSALSQGPGNEFRVSSRLSLCAFGTVHTLRVDLCPCEGGVGAHLTARYRTTCSLPAVLRPCCWNRVLSTAQGRCGTRRRSTAAMQLSNE